MTGKTGLSSGLSMICIGFVASLAAALGANAAAASSVYPGCSTPPPSPKRSLHVVPSALLGNGTPAAPMSLERALSTVQPGDTLYLANGDYGTVTLKGENAAFVTLTAEPGEQPRLKALYVGSWGQPAARWRISNLVIEGARDSGLESNGWQNHGPLVQIHDSNDIVFDANVVQTVAGAYKWVPEIQGQRSPEQLVSGVDSIGSSCVAITNNKISNVFHGIRAGGNPNKNQGERLLLSGNEIIDFAGDAIDHFGSYISIIGNRIENSHDVCKLACNHSDGIQGWNYNGIPGITNKDIFIAQNTIIDRIVPHLDQPPSDLHGITFFDGNWDGVKVENNIVVSWTYHGISLYGVQNAEVINNTVLSTDPARAAWIMINLKKGDPPVARYATVVRNNISSSVAIGQPGRTVLGVTADHNVLTRNPKGLFIAYDPGQGRYDLHLSKHSAAVGAGTADKAPATDLEGHERVGKTDAGALAASSS